MTTYKKYVRDVAIEIREDVEAEFVPLSAYEVRSPKHPVWERPTTPYGPMIGPGFPDGMHLMHSLPTREIMPAGFLKGSAQYLVDVVDSVRQEWSGTDVEAVQQWEEFAQSAPSSDLVHEYLDRLDTHFHIPLRKYLFDGIPVQSGELVQVS
jgi:hypothetical protein